MTDPLPPAPSGGILTEEFRGPLGITQYKLAHDIGVPRSRIAEMVNAPRLVRSGA